MKLVEWSPSWRPTGPKEVYTIGDRERVIVEVGWPSKAEEYKAEHGQYPWCELISVGPDGDGREHYRISHFRPREWP